MNRLSIEKRVQIIQMLVEGNSLRSTSRMADVSINTVTKLLVDVGKACMKFHDEKVRNIKARYVQCDEIWSFVYSKQKNVPEGMEGAAGDIWTWTGIDAETKLIISWYVGNRDLDSADYFIHDLKDRISNPIQLTTDGHKPYLQAVEKAFEGSIDYAMLVKLYGQKGKNQSPDRSYSNKECSAIQIERISGAPRSSKISTSYVERQNLTMRMHMRRFTRLTNAFSKKIENHCYAIALHFVYYNFAKFHKSLGGTPAMQAGIMNRWLEISDIVNLSDKFSN